MIPFFPTSHFTHEKTLGLPSIYNQSPTILSNPTVTTMAKPPQSLTSGIAVTSVQVFPLLPMCPLERRRQCGPSDSSVRSCHFSKFCNGAPFSLRGKAKAFALVIVSDKALHEKSSHFPSDPPPLHLPGAPALPDLDSLASSLLLEDPRHVATMGPLH